MPPTRLEDLKNLGTLEHRPLGMERSWFPEIRPSPRVICSL